MGASSAGILIGRRMALIEAVLVAGWWRRAARQDSGSTIEPASSACRLALNLKDSYYSSK
jgi:hypothetical protein